MNPARSTLLWTTRILGAAAAIGLATCILFGAYGEPVHVQAQGPLDRPGLILPKLDRGEFPGCVPVAKFDGIPAALIVVTHSGDIRSMAFDQAWERGQTTNGADNVWAIGACI